jgi:hypothetical protein
MSRSLKGVLCEDCRSRGHACQAQVWIDEKPLCLRCADGEPCCFETAKGVELPEWRREMVDIYTITPRQVAFAPAPRPVKVQTPKFEASELRQMRAELEHVEPEKVAIRHGLAVATVEQFQVQELQRKQEREHREQAVELEHLAATMSELQEAVALHFGMTRAELKMTSRAQKVVKPRQIAMYLATRIEGSTLGSIGIAFGGMHHTTVLHSIHVIDRGIKSDTGLRDTVRTLQDRLSLAALRG